VKNYGSRAERVSKFIDGKTCRCFLGIKLKPVDQIGIEIAGNNAPPSDDPFA
jgi:hypothetical protein